MGRQNTSVNKDSTAQVQAGTEITPYARPFPKTQTPPAPIVDVTASTAQASPTNLLTPLSQNSQSSPTATPIMPKLTVGAAGDKYEKEADAVASQVVQQLNSPPSVQQAADHISERETQTVQMKPMVQLKGASAGGAASPELEQSIQRERGRGQTLSESLRNPLENAFGADFSGVRIHTDNTADQLNQSIQAKAFTTGQDVFFRQGAYAPGSKSGQELIAHELTHVVQQGGSNVQRSANVQENQTKSDINGISNASDPEVIQRRIGFEVETGIPITELVDDDSRLRHGDVNDQEWHECYPDDMGRTVQYNQMIISADAAPKHTETVTEPFDQWSIIEMVTNPIDDSMSVDNFETIARGWISTLIALKNKAQNTPPAQKITGTPYYVGLPSPQTYNSWDRIAPQSTVGVPLDQAAKVISQFPISGTVSAARATEQAKKAPAIATKVMKDLIGFITPGNSAGVNDLKGLVTLMCNYLLVGGHEDCAKMIYMKNRPSNIFYKSKLSTVRNNLVGTDNSYGKTILSDGNGRAALRQLLLLHTGRYSNQRLFIEDTKTNQGHASTVTVSTWLDEVLNGVDDKIFDEMKNDWSTDINPDANNEVVIELRKLGYNLTHSSYELEQDDGLLGYMKKVYLANKAIKNHQDE